MIRFGTKINDLFGNYFGRQKRLTKRTRNPVYFGTLIWFNIFNAKMKFMESKVCTDFLFAQAGFLTGAASGVNIPGNFYDFNYSSSDEEADAKAIECDWMMVGRDMEIAKEKVKGNSINSHLLHECISE